MFDVLGVCVLLALVTLGGWLVVKSGRARHPAVKWVGLSLSGVITLVFSLVLCLALVGFYKIDFPPGRPPLASLKVAGTPELVARGARFASICAGCHSKEGKPPLAGQNFFEGGPPFGTMWATNLTPAGEIAVWSDGDVVRAIREGVHKSGRALVVMPSEVFRNLSDADAQAIVAFLRSQPSTGARTPATRLNVLGAALLGAGLFPTAAQAPITQPTVAPAEGPSAEYGKYLVSVLACTVCHGENLAGRAPGKLPGPPAGPNLTAIVPGWSADVFIHVLRTGTDPSGRKVSAEMPWKQISGFASDDDLRAMHAYLHGLTPITSLTPPGK